MSMERVELVAGSLPVGPEETGKTEKKVRILKEKRNFPGSSSLPATVLNADTARDGSGRTEGACRILRRLDSLGRRHDSDLFDIDDRDRRSDPDGNGQGRNGIQNPRLRRDLADGIGIRSDLGDGQIEPRASFRPLDDRPSAVRQRGRCSF